MDDLTTRLKCHLGMLILIFRGTQSCFIIMLFIKFMYVESISLVMYCIETIVIIRLVRNVATPL